MLRPVAELADVEMEALLFDTGRAERPSRRMLPEIESADSHLLHQFVAGLCLLRAVGYFLQGR